MLTRSGFLLFVPTIRRRRVWGCTGRAGEREGIEQEGGTATRADDLTSLSRRELAREIVLRGRGRSAGLLHPELVDEGEDIDVIGTQRVINRAMLSSVLCVFGVVVHPDAQVTGALRYVGVALSSAAALSAITALLAFTISMLRML